MRSIHIPSKKEQEQLEAEAAAQAELDYELELFEKYELECFIDDMTLNSSLTDEEVLEALDLLFFRGWANTPPYSWGYFQGRTRIESSYEMYHDMEESKYPIATVARGLERTFKNLSGAPDGGYKDRNMVEVPRSANLGMFAEDYDGENG